MAADANGSTRCSPVLPLWKSYCIFFVNWFVPEMSPTLCYQTLLRGLTDRSLIKSEPPGVLLCFSAERWWAWRGGRFNTQSLLLLLSVGAKHRDGLGVRSVRWFNGRSEAAWGDGFNHICLLITLPSAASELRPDINAIQVQPPPPFTTKTVKTCYDKVLFQVAFAALMLTRKGVRTGKKLHTSWIPLINLTRDAL